MNNVEKLINFWKKSDFSKNVAKWECLSPTDARFLNFPDNLHPALRTALIKTGVTQLYSHQRCAIEVAHAGKNLVISTGTASGKTLCYNLPVLNEILNNSDTSAIYLFPTKALTADQFNKLYALNGEIRFSEDKLHESSVVPAIYDGDTAISDRNQIRMRANIILTNPDMLHIGILPHHTIWELILRNLKFVVIDEIHIYRGVFGSHLTNVLRRLKRIAHFYGSHPQFIMTSATIANASDFAEKIIEEPVSLIDDDGSAYGKRNLILYNPPIVDKELGLRNGIVSESVKVAGDLISQSVQTILFARSRKTVEITLRYLQYQYEYNADIMHGYRSGYLPWERRKIEEGLRDGSIRTVVSTNALELGIDMGSMDAIVMMGYPGTIAAFRQQSGRAGRRKGDSLALMIASSSPMDQFIVQHPDFLFKGSVEHALINPNNPLILLAHLKCAAFELPFMQGDHFGSLNWLELKPYFEFLYMSQDVYSRGNRYLWMADSYPANQVSLRSASAQPILLVCQEQDRKSTIGEVDAESANWIVHPGAVYLHEGNSYLVNTLKFNERVAELSHTDLDYYTEPKKDIDIQIIQNLNSENKLNYQKNLGEILVTSKVTGFQKIRWFTREILGNEELDMPPTELRTIAYWLTLSASMVKELRKNDLWKNDKNNYGPSWNGMRLFSRKRDNFTCQFCGAPESGKEHHVHHKIPFKSFINYEQANHLENLITLCPICHQRVEQNVRIRTGLSGLGYALAHLAPVILMCAEKDLGAFSDPQAKIADMQPTVVIYDQFPGGIGLSESLYQHDAELIQDSYELVSNCACSEGCPSCVGPAGENGSGGKEETIAILNMLIEK